MSRRGFTIIEVLLSMALVGLVLVGLNTFVFSMGELWGRNADVRLFDQHVRAVTRFLQGEMLRASLPPAASANATPVGIQPVTPDGLPQDKLVTYMELSGSRILRWPDYPLPEVYCSLQVRRGQGMFILWHSDLENHFSDDPPRETLVSPFITALAYDYFDTDFSKWTTETVLRTDATGNPLPPQRLRITFSYDRLTRETLVSIPQTKPGLPNPW
ncbi:MAG TPA: prepilin-type N-terminal cleavage/methylation domain-containing protein [Opitutaceae bacterium]|nr:prepilin-type N-terminal cleavage/methylation domain-containing protein [Opitutaceae bacterium]